MIIEWVVGACVAVALLIYLGVTFARPEDF